MKNTGVFILAAVFFVAASVWATTIGTNIDSTGTIGVATSTPWGDLAVEQVAGNTKLHPVFVVGDSGTTSPFLFVSQKGNIGIGTSTPNKVLNIPLTGTTLLLGASNGGATSRIVLESLDPNINLADSNGTAGQRVGAIKQDSNVMSFFGVSDAGSVNTNAYLRFKVSDGNFEVGDGGALFDGELSVYQTGS
ncbi:MAG: hypothetical protein HY470_01740, partial [Candidatus Ryanbacteria bacterium]|nr:hypothetical protein [Candidatus Ryanbacteria bacterium]